MGNITEETREWWDTLNPKLKEALTKKYNITDSKASRKKLKQLYCYLELNLLLA